ncbi:protein kinase family protein [Pseudomonas syringae group genomosp. 3]|uniref:protein kinase family protein n=1 Tax=Pseudomonas syringae group genomosp. 3 TaxID=251701 RepID=UPI001903DE01|nr:protein kinase family protein [Pseudomonas syringae group genomosp. 3]QQN26691.1 protein kinase family protein [Pseudomonas syringae pv. maculicola]
MQINQKIHFPLSRSFVLQAELGQGACGKTVLLHDDEIDEYLVCKKYSPLLDEWKEALYKGFVGEIKLMYSLHHINVVRVFNYMLYPEKYAGYIFMEYVEGTDIEEYLTRHPESTNEVFLQIIDAFAHLESRNILHRDIRPSNLMVTNDGVVKIIDFGFGKKVLESVDFDKSISLNWWCELPVEFESQLYTHATEVYFVGKLFDKIIFENAIVSFNHSALLEDMTKRSPHERIDSFARAREAALTNTTESVAFTNYEISTYQDFSRSLEWAVSKIVSDAKYFEVDEFSVRLEKAYKSVMLENQVASNTEVIKCFINGAYYYNKNHKMAVSVIKNFLALLCSSSKEKRNIIEANIYARLDAVERYKPKPLPDFDSFDDIPF